jgi:hypothetical protein
VLVGVSSVKAVLCCTLVLFTEHIEWQKADAIANLANRARPFHLLLRAFNALRVHVVVLASPGRAFEGRVFQQAHEGHPVVPCCDRVRVDRHEPVAHILDEELLLAIELDEDVFVLADGRSAEVVVPLPGIGIGYDAEPDAPEAVHR